MTKTRQKAQLNPFGKKVMHHLINSEQNLIEFAKKLGACGEVISPSSLRRLMSLPDELLGGTHSTVSMSWISNAQVPMFMREYACAVHGAELVELYSNYMAISGEVEAVGQPSVQHAAE